MYTIHIVSVFFYQFRMIIIRRWNIPVVSNFAYCKRHARHDKPFEFFLKNVCMFTHSEALETFSKVRKMYTRQKQIFCIPREPYTNHMHVATSRSHSIPTSIRLVSKARYLKECVAWINPRHAPAAPKVLTWDLVANAT